jgi:hypothetical protein
MPENAPKVSQLLSTTIRPKHSNFKCQANEVKGEDFSSIRNVML